jgi:hypothetical protein
MAVLPDIDVGLLMLDAPDGEIGGGAGFAGLGRKHPHIGDEAPGARARVLGPGGALNNCRTREASVRRSSAIRNKVSR